MLPPPPLSSGAAAAILLLLTFRALREYQRQGPQMHQYLWRREALAHSFGMLAALVTGSLAWGLSLADAAAPSRGSPAWGVAASLSVLLYGAMRPRLGRDIKKTLSWQKRLAAVAFPSLVLATGATLGTAFTPAFSALLMALLIVSEHHVRTTRLYRGASQDLADLRAQLLSQRTAARLSRQVAELSPPSPGDSVRKAG